MTAMREANEYSDATGDPGSLVETWLPVSLLLRDYDMFHPAAQDPRVLAAGHGGYLYGFAAGMFSQGQRVTADARQQTGSSSRESMGQVLSGLAATPVLLAARTQLNSIIGNPAPASVQAWDEAIAVVVDGEALRYASHQAGLSLLGIVTGDDYNRIMASPGAREVYLACSGGFSDGVLLGRLFARQWGTPQH